MLRPSRISNRRSVWCRTGRSIRKSRNFNFKSVQRIAIKSAELIQMYKHSPVYYHSVLWLYTPGTLDKANTDWKFEKAWLRFPDVAAYTILRVNMAISSVISTARVCIPQCLACNPTSPRARLPAACRHRAVIGPIRIAALTAYSRRPALAAFWPCTVCHKTVLPLRATMLPVLGQLCNVCWVS